MAFGLTFRIPLWTLFSAFVAKIGAGADDIVISDIGFAQADVTHDGELKSSDCSKIVRYVVGLATKEDLAQAGD